MAGNASWEIEVKPNLSYLTKHITNLKSVLISLIEKGIISEDESETIWNETTELNKNSKLLDIIRTKDWKIRKADFITTLRDTNNEHCVKVIEEASISASTTVQHNYSKPTEIKIPNTFGFNHSTKRVLNILLLGKSGVGKSTFINSFANYVSFDTIDNIQGVNSIRVPIPCSFDMCDYEGNLRNFKMGEESNQDCNESMNSISSGTHGCKAYQFDFEDLQINLVDTPAILDTHGIEKDKQNMDDIFDFIGNFYSFNGICILLKPNEERLDPILRYCILELLSQLDISAAQNIVFGFTNARGTLYRLGSTAKVIQELIAEINSKKTDSRLKFSKENYFCFDNEAFRFLISKDSIEFDDFDRKLFLQSWSKSRQECVRMIKYIAGLPEHDMHDTIYIRKARKIVGVLLNPLVEIGENIMENKEKSKTQEREIIIAQGDISVLQTKLYNRFETRKSTEMVLDDVITSKLKTEEDTLLRAENFLMRLKMELKELEKEYTFINRASSMCALFLKNRTITPYNDATEEYLDYILKLNKNDSRITDENIRARKRFCLKDQKCRYQNEKAAIENGCEKADGINGNQILPKHIDDIVAELCSLKRYGWIFRNSVGENHEMKKKDYRFRIIGCSVSKMMTSLFQNKHPNSS